ncbi:hypothetical protein LOD99_14875 [Oopsacas minuta]|uniref:BZIP domain-containing protein n=1 Tax=Oopsacas minuta TaxID=111878 RepID=A0AAV7KFS8_9METZ|nr:hypothetical protein LOD99_14875 [Oopsacas minuta]
MTTLTFDYEQKLNISKAILVENYHIRAEKTSFLNLIHKDRVYSVTINEFNKIINRECFTDIERAYIREQRKKAVNRKAARVSRKRRRDEDQSLEKTLRNLQSIKYGLLERKDILENEIHFYKQGCEQMRYMEYHQGNIVHNSTPYGLMGYPCN